MITASQADRAKAAHALLRIKSRIMRISVLCHWTPQGKMLLDALETQVDDIFNTLIEKRPEASHERI